jgi:hypothetical protein
VAPDVATGRVVVVVGGEVVVVVGGMVVVVVVGDEEPAPSPDKVGVVVGGVVVVVGATDVEVLGVCSGALPDAVAPGCSLETTMPRTTVAPAAATAASRVRKRRDVAARRRASGVWTCRVDFIDQFLGSAATDENSHGYVQPWFLLWTDCEGSLVLMRRHLDPKTGADLRGTRRFMAARGPTSVVASRPFRSSHQEGYGANLKEA